MLQKGFAPILLPITAIMIVILGTLAYYSLPRNEEFNIGADLSKKAQTDRVEAEYLAKTENEISDTSSTLENISSDPNATSRPSEAGSSASTIKSVDSNSQIQQYVNSEERFSISYPKSYQFTEPLSPSNFYPNSEISEGNRTTFSWEKRGVSDMGMLLEEKITLSFYPQDVSKEYLTDPKTKEETIVIGDQLVKKKLSSDGKIITIGPIEHNEKSLFFRYYMPSKSFDQTNFLNIISSLKLL